ncbi:MAG: hypothetical protein IJC37_03200 [Clostridia bacterium]|nr:hypothetical protein [Clostridia bacterium]
MFFLDKKKLYILTYDHGGFVLWGDRVKPRLRDLAVWMEKYPDLRIGLDYESFTFDEFMRQDPETVRMIAELLEKYPDRFGLGATTYGQPLSLFISEESNVRQLTYAVRTNLKYFGKTPSVYAISEFALNNQTPQLISQCGYEAAILRSHVMGYGYTKTFDSPWGRWIGKDLTEIPAVPTYHNQGRGFNCTTVDNWILSRWPVDSDLYSLENFEKMFSDYEPLLASRYDDLTQPIEEITAHTQKVDNYEYILLEDIPEIFGEATDELKTADNDFHAQMPWGYCGNEIFNGCRQGEVDALQGEKLNAFSVMLGGDSLESTSEEAWKYILAAQHHDVTICGLLDLSRRFIPESLRLSDKVKTESFSALSAKFASSNGESLLVVNPHSFDIDEWLEVPVDYSCCAYDADSELECENTVCNGKSILRVHVCLSPLTVKRYEIRKTAHESESDFCYHSENGVLTTPLYKVKFTEKGIAYIDCIADSQRIYDNEDGALFTAFIEDKECASSGKWRFDITAHSAKAVQEGMIGSIPYRFEMSFAGKRARIDCKARFEMHGEHVGRTDITQGRPVPLTRNGHHHEDKLCFVMNLCLDKNRRMVRDLPFAVSDWNGALLKPEEYWYPDDRILIDTEVSQEESFNSTTYMQGIYWIGLRDTEKGIAVFNKGCMGSAISGNTVRIPLLYSNLYMCGTRILDGVFEDEFALMPFNSSVSDIDIHKASMAYNYPPVAGVAAKGNGSLCEFSAASLNTKGSDVILTALYPENSAVLARFCNFSDNPASIEFTPSVGRVTAQTDLLGNETEKVTGNELSFRPWEIKTVMIEEV